ncbi:RING-type domain-containing protein [Mycena chlorophos]|uniref:RING-type domain-containing protein n=1 Tax=Mycena chlorophos TaxID=658473 RepID=A0A8H6TDW3_MYCCL|nr:RING-type domain-containing protein [Mycena chlorophos]
MPQQIPDVSTCVPPTSRLVNALDSRQPQSGVNHIGKLSPELLTEIFLALAIFTRRPADDPASISPFELRTGTLFVCRYWRDVARASARLWGFLIDYLHDSKEFVEEALERTGCTPLFVQANVIHRETAIRNVALALKTATSRIEVLDVAIISRDMKALAPVLVNQPAPILEVFRIGCHGAYADLPALLFAGEVPRLRELQLESCILKNDFNLLQCKTLTYLSVERTGGVKLSFSVNRWLQILGQLPQLEVLSLTKSFGSLKTDQDASHVQLPRLFSIAVEGSLGQCAGILTHLHFPPTPCVEIRCTLLLPELLTTQALTQLLEPVSANFKGLSEKLRALGIAWKHTGVTFRGAPSQSACVDAAAMDSEFVLALKGDDAIPYQHVLAVAKTLALEDVRVLDLSTPVCQCGPPSHFVFRPDRREEWGALLRCFPGVHTLQPIANDWAESVLDLLRYRDEDYKIFLPSLRTLAFVNTSFVQGGTVGARVRSALVELVQHGRHLGERLFNADLFQTFSSMAIDDRAPGALNRLSELLLYAAGRALWLPSVVDALGRADGYPTLPTESPGLQRLGPDRIAQLGTLVNVMRTQLRLRTTMQSVAHVNRKIVEASNHAAILDVVAPVEAFITATRNVKHATGHLTDMFVVSWLALAKWPVKQHSLAPPETLFVAWRTLLFNATSTA